MHKQSVIAFLTAAAIGTFLPALAHAGNDGIRRQINVTQMKPNNANDASRARASGTLSTTVGKPSTAQSMGLSKATANASIQREKKDIRIAPRSGRNRNGEMGMIELQSLVSQRQNALNRTTNIVKKTQCKECINNIGR